MILTEKLKASSPSLLEGSMYQKQVETAFIVCDVLRAREDNRLLGDFRSYEYRRVGTPDACPQS